MFHSRECRHKGPRRGGDAVPPSEEELARLFDQTRDPNGLVDEDEWHPTSWSPVWVELDLVHTVAKRRRWYRTLVEEGML